MKRAVLLACLVAAPALPPAWAGGVVLAPPTISIQPRNPVLDPKCVDRIKGSGGSAARAAHECRKAYNPGTPPPLAAREHPATATPASPKP
jgi:hypothetical protein